jgi:hypothetical protein
MPWGHPDSREAMYCVGCGVIGVEWVQRRPLGATRPTPRVRVCPPCHQGGWRLVGAVEAGAFYLRQVARARPEVA